MWIIWHSQSSFARKKSLDFLQEEAEEKEEGKSIKKFNLDFIIMGNFFVILWL